MKKRMFVILLAIFMFVMLGACQDVFTSSAYFWYEPNMDDMTEEQKISYAEDLLSAGATTEELTRAFDEIKKMLPENGDYSKAEPELVVLAADLAIGSSGIGDAVNQALELISQGGDEGSGDAEDTFESVQNIINNINTENLSDAVELIEAAATNEAVELTTEQYANAAAAQILVVVDSVKDVETIDDITDEQKEQLEEDLGQALDWAEQGGVELSSIFGDSTSEDVNLELIFDMFNPQE